MMNSQCTPNLIIVGASKCGTTALYKYLEQNPNFFVPDRKELHYFSNFHLSECSRGPGDADVLDQVVKTWDDYTAVFQSAAAGQVSVEVSPSYFYFQECADIINERILDNTKIVIMLRNPVQKIFSQYVHLVNEGRETESFLDALGLESKRKLSGYSDMWLYRESGYYFESCKKFIDVFGRSNVKIIWLEDFSSNPFSVLDELSDFVGIVRPFKYDSLDTVNHIGTPKSLLLAKLIAPNKFSNYVRNHFRYDWISRLKQRLKKYNAGKREQLCPDVYHELMRIYAQDLLALEGLMGSDKGIPFNYEKN